MRWEALKGMGAGIFFHQAEEVRATSQPPLTCIVGLDGLGKSASYRRKQP